MPLRYAYTQFCAEHPDIPVFSQPWWLDAVCPGQWDVILVEKKDRIIASFPYCKTKTRRFTHIEMPHLTQKLGPYIIYDSNKTSENKRIGYEHEVYNGIIERLPKYDALSVNFDWKYKNWLPFYWNGFSQTTRYTYIIHGIKDHDTVQKNYSKSKKQPIQKAGKNFTVKFDLPKDVFFSYYMAVIHERGESVSFSKELFFRLYDAVYEQKSGRTMYCVDSQNNIHAINMVVWDNECAYYLLAMRKKEYNTSGGTELLVNEAIKYVSQFVDRFDFEGSMIKGVEESYRHYGAIQTEYYTISKMPNSTLKTYRALKEMLLEMGKHKA
jgi:hypothetical protein